MHAKPAAQTSGIANSYDSADMERRVCKLLGFAGPFEIADLPDVTARIYAITPIIAGEVDLALLSALAARGPVALDVQGFVRVRDGDDLVFKPWPQMAEGLANVTYLKVDRAEAELLTGETDLVPRRVPPGRVWSARDRADAIVGSHRARGRQGVRGALHPALARRAHRSRRHVFLDLSRSPLDRVAGRGLPFFRRRHHAQARNARTLARDA